MMLDRRAVGFRVAAIYVYLLAGYEAALAAIYAFLPSSLPITLDPHLPINWIFARQLGRSPSAVLCVFFIWHLVAATGLLRRIRRVVPAFLFIEILSASLSVFLFGGWIMTASVTYNLAGLLIGGILVFALCELMPIILAFRIVTTAQT